MNAQVIGIYPRSRTLQHPGRSSPIRIQSLSSAHGRHIRLQLEPGISVFEGIVQPLARMGITSASTTILGGYLEALQFCVAPPDPEKKAVIAYTPAIDAGPSYLIFGNATLGRNMAGGPLVHCHASFRGHNGAVQGGHVLTDRCIVGAVPITVLVTSFDGFELRQSYDPETAIPLLQPSRDVSNG